MRTQSFLTWTVAALAAAAPARAQQPAPGAADDSILQTLVREALERNPGLAGQQAAVRAAQLRIPPAGALPDPVVELGTIDPFKQFHSFTQVQVELVQQVPWPGTLGARSGAARAARDGAEADVGAARRDVTAAMATAYYRVRYLVTARETLEQQRRLLEAAMQVSTTRYATGAAPQSDPLQARLARDRLDAEGLALQGEYTAAVAAVNALRDKPPADSVPAAPLAAAAVRARLAALPETDSLVARALAAHPRIAARRAALVQAGRTIRAERLAGRPDVSFRFDYQYNGPIPGFNVPDYVSAFVGLRLPIWAGRKQHRLADAARADSIGADAALRAAEVELAQEVVQTAARADAARRRLELLVDGVTPTARGTVESVLRAYQVGRTEFLTLLAVQDALFRAELEAAAVTAEYQTQLVMLRQLTAEERKP